MAFLIEPGGVFTRAPLEDGGSGVEEHIELIYSYSEETCEEEMTELMDDHQNGERQNELGGFYQKSIQL